jgi:hypothetical protein
MSKSQKRNRRKEGNEYPIGCWILLLVIATIMYKHYIIVNRVPLLPLTTN